MIVWVFYLFFIVIFVVKIYFVREIIRFFMGEGGGGLCIFWEYYYMVIICMMLCNCISVLFVFLISDYRREMIRLNCVLKK